ncbi:MAG TPA: type II toxin-antitoxin system RelE/ParE family toxin [Candidatus Dormibacteraeota bacterium]
MSWPPPTAPVRRRRRWRFYGTPAGREPVRDFLYDPKLSDADAAAIAVAMREVRAIGREHPDVYHLRGDIWQIEIDGQRVIFRLLFAEEGRFGQVLLALEVVTKKWQKAREQHIRLAEKRLSDWRQRGR